MGLAISRKNGQTVIIDGCVTITVYTAHRATLKIDAPKHVHIRRGELSERPGDERRTLSQ